ncbi:MAG: FkbM family methyltransferase [Rickettsiales bacterium]|jgi:FkbM family methyltransferase|nr:FkbM family methyltransferase [Rickettsiales bacterium]
MKVLGKKRYPNGDKKYFFFGLPILSKKRSNSVSRTYLFGIRIIKRKFTPPPLSIVVKIQYASISPELYDAAGKINFVSFGFLPSLLGISQQQFDSDAKTMLNGLDKQSKEIFDCNLYRLVKANNLLVNGARPINQKPNCAPWCIFYDETQIKKFEKMHSMKATDMNGKYFELNGYKLYKNTFEPSIFVDEYGLDGLKSKDRIIKEGLAIFDVGAYVGDSALIFARHFSNNPIYAAEVLTGNFEEMKRNIALNNAKNIVPINVGFSDSTGYMDCAAFDAPGQLKCKMETLDNYVKENKIKVGLIKVDIEGAEQLFLKGALQTIREQKPTLILSIYHNYDDLMHILPMIDSLGLGYKFSLTDSNYGWFPVHELTLNCEIE